MSRIEMRLMTRGNRVRLPVLLALLGIATAAACDGKAAREASDDPSGKRIPADAPALVAPDAGYAMRARPAAQPFTIGRVTAEELPPPQRPGQVSDSTRMLIRRGNVFIRVDSLEPAMDAVRQLATRLGGMVGNVLTSAGEMQVRSATIQLRIPAARFEEALTGLKPIGRLESSSITAEDVGEEFVDMTARQANSRRLEDRLVSLLANRTGKLEDVLAVERELARVRQEIESYEARLRYLRNHIALSTIEVTVSEHAPIATGRPGENPLVEAFKGAWRNFVALVSFAIRSLGIIVPLALLLVGYTWIRGRRRRSADVG